MGGAAILLIIIVIAALGGLAFCIFACPFNLDIGAKPNIPLSPNEKPVPFSRVRIGGVSYGLWDIRDNSTSLLKFMVLVNPNDGTVIHDAHTQSEAFAIRLAFLTAYLVKSINDRAQNAQDAAGRLAGLQNAAAFAARYVGQESVADSILKVGTDLQEKTGSAIALAATLDSSKDTANALVRDPSDTNADLFLSNLGLTTAVSSSQRAAFIGFLFSNTLQQANIPVGSWLEQIYESITGGANPSLSLLSATFGTYEASQTTSALESRGEY